MRLDNNQRAFFELLKAGLWGDQRSVQEFNIQEFKDVDWERVYQLAQEQSVQGIVLRGIEELRAKNLELSVPRVQLLQWIGEVRMIEQQNKEMNAFIADLIEKLRKNDVYAILVKGQGIAQCYEKPFWRCSGDVDLLLSDSNYEKAKSFLVPLAERLEKEFVIFKHYGMTIKGWEVELHGTLCPRLTKRINRAVDDAQHDVFYLGNVRSWENGKVQVFMPGPNEDIIFQITHILKHFYQGGIGLRQICDLSRFLWTYNEKIDVRLLKNRLLYMGIMSEWKSFGAFMVEHLGTPGNVIPLYSENRKWKRKAERICQFVLEVGNFGHNRDYDARKYPFVIKKAISLWWRTADSFRHFFIFPLNSLKVWMHVIITGVIVAVSGK